MRTSPYLQEVIDAHVEIEQWLSGAAPAENLAPLLARFSAQFSMVSPKGTLLVYDDLSAIFSGGHGSRPGLRIHIDGLQTVQEWAGGAVVCYREKQVLENGDSNIRLSTAVFTRSAEEAMKWIHLHETFA
ncbi:DUF4440 domain-containing protein [Pseudoduganella violacea]|uniref:DUF4440 domain-containing protein n=1 Tax=Pseudoduganella violacea TaxID=1715466 RepID=A0A7W5FTA4_9BURK|nr:DUF4440 domain-containing protein [Pseudoduganella violacea]MBB3118640.1 hypothetical protein [Pseudoduganella violacea]